MKPLTWFSRGRGPGAAAVCALLLGLSLLSLGCGDTDATDSGATTAPTASSERAEHRAARERGNTTRSEGPSIFAQFTPKEMSLILREHVEIEAKKTPEKIAVAQLSFTQPVRASVLEKFFADYSIEATTELYYVYGTEGGGAGRIPSDTPLATHLSWIYGQLLESASLWLKQDQELCNTLPKQCDKAALEKGQATKATLESDGELRVRAIAVRGKLKDFAAFWEQHPEIFAIQLEPNNKVHGQPLFLETEMGKWF